MRATFLLVLGLLHLVPAVPEPGPEPVPDPEPDIQIDVSQEVNAGGCCNGCKEPECCSKNSCPMCGVTFSHGSVYDPCLQIYCNDGFWEFTGKHVRELCGTCGIGGDVQVVTFDNVTGPVTPYQQYYPEAYGYSGTGEFIFSQSGVAGPSIFGVKGKLSKRVCGTATCLDSITYYENDLDYDLVFPPRSLAAYCADYPTDPQCFISIEVNGMSLPIPDRKTGMDGKVKILYGLFGATLVFKAQLHGKDLPQTQNLLVDPAKDYECVVIIGAKSYVVVACNRFAPDASSYNGATDPVDLDYPFAFVMPEPALFREPDSLLFGLCNTFTNHPHEYVEYGGDTTTNVTAFVHSWELPLH